MRGARQLLIVVACLLPISLARAEGAPLDEGDEQAETSDAEGTPSDEVDEQPQSAEEVFNEGTRAVEQGRYSQAIADFEQLSDQGVRDAHACYNRALAYLQRAESSAARDGDWGQAAAALREATLLGFQEQAPELLERVRHAISRRRAQRGLDPVVVRPALGRAVLTLVPETFWASLAILSSLVSSAGLLLWRRGSLSTRALTGKVMTAAGLLVLVFSAGMTFGSRHLRFHETEAVIIVKEAKMLDSDGRTLSSKALDVDATAIPEGASIFVLEQRGRLARVTWGATEAWVQLGQLRFVGRQL